MQTIVITPMLPALSERDRAGKHLRTEIFLRALASVSRSMEIVYLVPNHLMELANDPLGLDRSQSDFWGVDLKASLLPRSMRRESLWNHYVQGMFDAAAQPGLFPYSGPALAEQIGSILDRRPDCVFIDRLDAMIPVLASGRRLDAMILDIDDLYHKVLGRKLLRDPWRLGKLALAMQLPALVQAERRAVARSKLSLVCSDSDQAHLRRLGFRGALGVIPNAIVPPLSVPPLTTEPTVLFLGSLHHPPNQSAAVRLVTRIWPLIRAEMPDAHLIIAGAPGNTPLPDQSPTTGVEYAGFVEDLATLYARARLVCSPIVQGSGTRLKLIEAAAYARPMVSTAMGAEGLEFRDGEDILLRESDAELARACVHLLRDDEACHRLGTNARRKMTALYDARVVQARLADMIRASVSLCGPI